MIKVIVFGLIFLLGCSTSSERGDSKSEKPGSIEKNIEAEQDKVTGLFNSIRFTEKAMLNDFQKEFLDQVLKNGEGEFETDSLYEIVFNRNYEVAANNFVFYVKGKFIPSHVDFHFYGAFNDKHIQYDIYHLPVATYFTLTRYELSSHSLRVYGILENENSVKSDEVLLTVLTLE